MTIKAEFMEIFARFEVDFWRKLSRDVVDFPSLEVLKKRLDLDLSEGHWVWNILF